MIDIGSHWADANNGIWVSNITTLEAYQQYFLAGATDGSSNLLFLSEDDGNTWSQINTVNPAGAITCFAEKDTILFMGTYEDGVYRSINGGFNWTRANNSGLEHSVMDLAVIDSILLAGTWGGGVYKSTDNGNTWTMLSSPNFNFHVTSMSVIDSGKTWEQIGLENVIVVSFTYHHSYLFAGTVQGVYRTENEGAIWNHVNNGLNSMRVDALATVDTVVYAGTGYGVYRTINNGASWSPFGFADTAVTSLLNVDNNLFAATPFGIYALTINDAKWVLVGVPDSKIVVNSGHKKRTHFVIFQISYSPWLVWNLMRSGKF